MKITSINRHTTHEHERSVGSLSELSHRVLRHYVSTQTSREQQLPMQQTTYPDYPVTQTQLKYPEYIQH